MIKIQINSRLVRPGDTFVAIKGNVVDGHNYVEDAIKNGATTVVVSNKEKYNVKTIKVKNTSKYLKDYLVKKYAKSFKDLKIIGLTGTNGKTTTAYMTYQLLRKVGINVAYIGTIGFYYNDEFEKTANTTPDILSLYNNLFKAKEKGCQIVIIEASSIGLKEGRMAGLKFDAAVFTNLTHDHLDYHKTMKEYMIAKLELFRNLKKHGTAIVNIDSRYGKFFTVKKRTITYGFKDATIRCKKHDESYSNITYVYNGNTYELQSPLFGKYNIYNAMASIGILLTLGIDIEKINEYYPTLEAPKGRINIIDYKTNKIIIDYAHTPDGLKQVLTSASKLTSGKTYVVFGCPGNRDRAKRPIMAKIADKYSDYFIITNDDPHYEDEMQIINDAIKGLESDKYDIIIDRKKAISKGIKLLKKDDTLLILGKGHEDSIIIKDKEIPHNDEKYVKEVIAKLTK
ncbi:MAG: UDP-N-acetylmuramoyl-L-alanyl-D-glutamate--2,6-diaminopimelate ligase [Firmicutes bacterium]|nr:UDP-N-acetylmuramoyl-L-alanyl-D-glutamate--2,6-diaminopimelate ligase [Bacillota bacterium]